MSLFNKDKATDTIEISRQHAGVVWDKTANSKKRIAAWEQLPRSGVDLSMLSGTTGTQDYVRIDLNLSREGLKALIRILTEIDERIELGTFEALG